MVCLLVDGKVGITPTDKFFAGFVRQFSKPCILVVNKCEKISSFDTEYYKLGFKELVAISAEHGQGMADLHDAIYGALSEPDGENTALQKIQDPFETDKIQIVIAGRPNAGKSTFINALLGDERLLTGPEAGITRESISIEWDYKDTPLKLIDTAGLRRKNQIKDNLEKLSVSDTINSIKFANVVVLMVDATRPLEQQDLNIASYVIEEGRGLVVAVNKWDLVDDKIAFKEEFAYQLNVNLSQAKGVETVYISALNHSNINQVLDACIETYKLWNKKISTGKLNAWLEMALESHPLPLQPNGRRVRIKYATQTKIRPPTFKFFTNNPSAITDSYKKFLIGSIRENLKLKGIPIRLFFSKSSNPYSKK
jgi:GTP-binding protein